MTKLSKDERGLLKSVESGEWGSIAKKGAELVRYREYARGTFKKDRRVSGRLKEESVQKPKIPVDLQTGRRS
jgi:hypothetical protein